MRVFLTGATGFIGSATAQAFLLAGHEVMALIRPSATLFRLEQLRPKLKICTGTLNDPSSYKPALMAFSPEAIVHCAWAGVTQRHGEDSNQVANVNSSMALAQNGIEAGMAHFLALGSQAEYGLVDGIASEDAPLAPQSDYGRAKIEAQQAVAEILRGKQVPFCWLRVFSTYGPGDENRWLVPSLIESILANKAYPLTKGEQLWDYLYIDDAAKAIVASSEQRCDGIYNLGSGIARPMRQVFEIIRDAIDPNYTLGIGDLPYRDGQVMHLEADISRLKAATGWTPLVPLEQGLQRTVDFFRQQIECENSEQNLCLNQ